MSCARSFPLQGTAQHEQTASKSSRSIPSPRNLVALNPSHKSIAKAAFAPLPLQSPGHRTILLSHLTEVLRLQHATAVAVLRSGSLQRAVSNNGITNATAAEFSPCQTSTILLARRSSSSFRDRSCRDGSSSSSSFRACRRK